MPRQSPGIFGARFCTKCGGRQRSVNHVCHPATIKKHDRLLAWQKRSATAHQAQKPKK